MNLYLIRHQKTQWNIDGRLQGLDDSQNIIFDDEFSDRVKKNERILRNVAFDVICSSPQKRALQTASAHNCQDYQIEANIIEYNFGAWEGCLRNDMIQATGEVWLNKFTEFRGGEPYGEFSSRIEAALHKYQHLDNVLFFTHGAVCRYLISRAKNLDPDCMNQLQVANNELIVLEA